MGSLMERKKAIMMMQRGSILPSEYQQVEWIRNVGHSYIDTGILANRDISLELDFQAEETTKQRYIMGRFSGTTFFLYISPGGMYQTSFGTTWANTDGVVDTLRHKLKYYFDNDILFITCDGTVIFQKEFSEQSYNTTLIGGPYTGYSYVSSKTYSVKMARDGETILNFIPCFRKSDDKPGMYDTVSQTFFTNAGADEFIIPS